MKSKVILKPLIIISCLLLSLNMKAQNIQYEDITRNFKWQIEPTLTIRSQNMTLLQVENLNARSKSSIKNKKIDSYTAFIDLEIKEPVVIELDVFNANTNPSKYKYRVYERDKNGKFKKKGTWHKDNIYWGVSIQMYSSDGSIVNDVIWISANSASYGINNSFSYILNNKSWESIGANYVESLPYRIITFPDNTLTIYNLNGIILHRTYSHIIGIKNIGIMVGTAANVSVRNFTILKPVVL